MTGVQTCALPDLVAHEGYSDRAIIPVKGDVPTIGFGTTDGVKIGDRIDPVTALSVALRDINKFEGAVKQCVKVPLYQYEYDAYMSLSYNIGTTNFCGSTLVKKLNNQDYTGACNEILRWTRFKNKDCKLPENKKLCGGLATRRIEENQVCLGQKK